MGTTFSTFFLVMVLLVATLFWVAYIANGNKNAGVHVICGAVIGIVMGMNTMYYAEKSIPKAIDVYRNKTELEVNYTIKNSDTNSDTIRVDSLVVFKYE